MHFQGDAEYLRYHGLQEFDQAMHHVEETYGVSIDALFHLLLGHRKCMNLCTIS